MGILRKDPFKDRAMADTASNPFPITNPALIPAERYYSEAFFKAEQEKLWPHVWQMACRLEEIPNQGDYTVYEIFDRSVILLNTTDGVKAFLNACRHRGVKLARGKGNCKNRGFRCPFHGWRWDEQGKNSFVFGREIFDEAIITPDQIDLAPVRVEFWAGCAFINFDDTAPSLRECLGPVAERMDTRRAETLKIEWWFGTVLPTNWKLAMEAFHEGYHVMQTHPQLFQVSPYATTQFGTDFDGKPVNEGLTGKEMVQHILAFLHNLNEGMGGSMIHKSELAVIDRLAGMDVPEDPMEAAAAFYTKACKDVEADARARGVETFDISKAFLGPDMHYVEFMFPNYFLLPVMGAMASYRIRPLTPETCLFEIWNLAPRADGETFETPKGPTMLPYDSQDFPEIPRQDYSNLPLQQVGLHNLDFMRIGSSLGKGGEGMISNYQRLIDGYIAGLPADTLAKSSQIVNCGFDAPIMDIGI